MNGYKLSNSSNASVFSSGSNSIILDNSPENVGIFMYANDIKSVSINNTENGTRLALTNNLNNVSIGCDSIGKMFLSVEGSERITISPSGLIDVTTSQSVSIPSYGYVSGLGSVGYDDIGETALVSMRISERLICKEINSTSDIRLKTNVHDLNLIRGYKFVEEVTPKSYNWRNQPSYHPRYGYIAQDLAKSDFNELILFHPNKISEYVDEDGFVSPEGSEMAVAYNDLIPLLHIVVKDLVQKNRQQARTIKILTSRIRSLTKRVIKQQTYVSR